MQARLITVVTIEATVVCSSLFVRISTQNIYVFACVSSACAHFIPVLLHMRASSAAVGLEDDFWAAE